MSEEKSLPSSRDKTKVDKGDNLKKIPSLSDSNNFEKRSLPDSNDAPVLPTSEVKSVDVEVPETLSDQIRKATVEGGLKKLPLNFDERTGDWKIINSNNYFEVLYLDHKQDKIITKEMIQNNYQLLKKFWDEKCSIYRTGSGGIPIQLEQKFGTEILRNAQSLLKKAYDTLIKPDGVKSYFNELESKRLERGRLRINPFLETIATVGILDPTTEGMIKSKGIEAELTEIEINLIIEQFLKSKRIERGEYSSRFKESERLFLYQIKKKLNDNVLNKEEENELKQDAVNAFNINENRFEELVLQALREVKGCERKSTINKDKEKFSRYYYELLANYGVDHNGNMVPDAQQRLFEMDSSATDFFPLKSDTRETLIKNVASDYLKNLTDEKIGFITEALKNLQKRSGTDKEGKKLNEETSSKFKLVLPSYREELIEKSIKIIEFSNELYFTETGKSLYRNRCWKISDADKKLLVSSPQLLFPQLFTKPNLKVTVNEKLLMPEFSSDDKIDFKTVYNISLDDVGISIEDEKHQVLITPDFEWTDHERRMKLLGETVVWSKNEYEFEKSYFEAKVNDSLKKCHYGTPTKIQIELETDKEFHLAEYERRTIIIALEKPLRQKAEKVYTELVKSKIGFNTIIPEIITYLDDENEKVYFLTEEKNNISFAVKTFKEIIDANSKTFDTVFDNLIEQLKLEKQFDSSLIQRFNLSKLACISKEDVITILKQFYFEDEEQYSNLFSEFKKIAEQKDFFIVEETAESEYQVFDIFNKAVEISSKSYNLRLSEWHTDAFVNDMVKIGAAYGMPEDKVKEYINNYKPQYLINTKPRWKEFYFFAAKFIIPFFLYRLLFTYKYPNWFFIEKSSSDFDALLLLDYITCVIPFYPSLSWAIFISILIIPFAFRKSVKKLLRSFNKVKLRLSLISASLLVFISVSSLIIGGSDQFKKGYIEKFIQNADDYVLNGKYNEAIKEYEKIFNLALPEERHRYYFERGQIYEKFSHSYNTVYNADLAISDYTSAINLNPNIAVYYFRRGNCLNHRGYILNSIPDYLLAKEDYLQANKLDPSLRDPITLTDPIKAVTSIDKKIINLKKRIKYQKAGFIPDSKIKTESFLYTNHSFTSSKVVGTVLPNEEVKKLDTWVINDPEIVEITNDLSLMSKGTSIIIPAGSLVKIIGKLDAEYIITYKNKQSEFSGRISKGITKEIVGIEWVKIKTLSGKTGWILKEFIY